VISPVTEERLLSYPEAAPPISTAPWPPRAAPSTTAHGRAWRPPSARLPAPRRSLITARLDEIAWAWTTQVGAPISLTQKAGAAERHAVFALRRPDRKLPVPRPPRRDDGGEVRVLREPVGVCAAISPWNAPMVLLSYKIAAGLAAGCTMVAKPSPETPLEAYILAECIEQAGLPRGVFNLVPAGREAGDHLVRHRASRRWPSPARPPWASISCGSAPTGWRGCRWNWAANPRPCCCRMPISPRPCPA
jgi:aldehyde dehydrogenase (NAD+)